MSLRHPITGALSNPEWDGVRDRWNERYCNAVLHEARSEPMPKPVNLIWLLRTCLVLGVGCLVFGAAWLL